MRKLFLIVSIGTVSLLAQPPMGGRGGRWGFGGFAGGPNAAPVTDAPYSAVEVRTSQQTLANGTVIQHQQQTQVYRDSMGRTRTELTMTRPDGQTFTRVVVRDPVAGVMLEIDPQHQTVHQMKIRTAAAPSGTTSTATPRRGPMNRTGNASAQTENLGVQTVNGMNATGTRITRTIAAGAQGNSQAIQSVRETWYSSDLQVPVMVKTSDPRTGTSTMQLNNIVRAEPDPSLFQAPAGYTVVQGGRGPRQRPGQQQ